MLTDREAVQTTERVRKKESQLCSFLLIAILIMIP